MLRTIISKLPEYRKAIVAAGAALVNIGIYVGLPVGEPEVVAVLGVFDAVAAFLVALVPND